MRRSPNPRPSLFLTTGVLRCFSPTTAMSEQSAQTQSRHSEDRRGNTWTIGCVEGTSAAQAHNNRHGGVTPASALAGTTLAIATLLGGEVHKQRSRLSAMSLRESVVGNMANSYEIDVSYRRSCVVSKAGGGGSGRLLQSPILSLRRCKRTLSDVTAERLL